MEARSPLNSRTPFAFEMPLGTVADVERRTGEFHAAGDLWRGQSPAHAGVRFQHAGGGEAAVQIVHQTEVGVAVHAQIERVLLAQRYAAGNAESVSCPVNRADATVTAEPAMVTTISPELRSAKAPARDRWKPRARFPGARMRNSAVIARGLSAGPSTRSEASAAR